MIELLEAGAKIDAADEVRLFIYFTVVKKQVSILTLSLIPPAWESESTVKLHLYSYPV